MEQKRPVRLDNSQLDLVTGGTDIQADPVGLITIRTCEKICLRLVRRRKDSRTDRSILAGPGRKIRSCFLVRLYL